MPYSKECMSYGQKRKYHTHAHTHANTLYLRELTTSTSLLWEGSGWHQLMLTESEVERLGDYEIKRRDGKMDKQVWQTNTEARSGWWQGVTGREEDKETWLCITGHFIIRKNKLWKSAPVYFLRICGNISCRHEINLKLRCVVSMQFMHNSTVGTTAVVTSTWQMQPDGCNSGQ